MCAMQGYRGREGCIVKQGSEGGLCSNEEKGSCLVPTGECD